MKKSLLTLIILMTIINVSAYQATTDAGRNVKKFVEELNIFVEDYRDYKRVINPHAVSAYPHSGRQEVNPGICGNGAYSARGGESYIVRYMGAEARGSMFAVDANAVGQGIEGGSHLHGYKLYYLYDKAILLDNLKENIAKVFDENVSGDQVIKLKKIFAELDFGSSVGKGLVTILNGIQVGGKTAVDLQKNYSSDAVSRSKVNAINKLNAAISSLYKVLSAEEYSLFFNYVSAFVDNGGSPTANVIIANNQNLNNIPDYQKYAPLPTCEELIESLVLENNNAMTKPLELTRITDDEDLKRILGKPYEDRDIRTEKFIELFDQAKNKMKNN